MKSRKDTVRNIEALSLLCKNGEVAESRTTIFVAWPYGFEREPGGRVSIGRSEK